MTGLRGHLVALLASVTLAGALAALLHEPLRGPPAPPGDGVLPLERAAASLLAAARRLGLRPDLADAAAFLEPDRGDGAATTFTDRRFVFAARPSPSAANRDVYLVRARVAPNGGVIAIGGLYNLTDSADGDERWLAIDGTRVAFATSFQGVFTGVTVLDLAGERFGDPRAPYTARLARRLSNRLAVGDPAGVEVTRFELEASTVDLRLRWDGGHLVVSRLDNDGWSAARVDPARRRVLDGGWLRPVETARATPSLLSWAVDTARGIPWIGPARIYALEKAWFRIADVAQSLANRLWRDLDDADSLREIEASVVGEDAAAFDEPPPEPAAPGDAPAHPLDRPPADIEPRLRPALEHEGRWRPYHFRRRPPGAPPTFWRTTLRVDPERPDAVTEMVLIDPRQVELRVVAGTEHPRSTTGAVGTGRVPAAERERTLAAFNGGFQAIHGGYGMAVDRRIFLPPRPRIATVALYDDGRPAFGTWPDEVGARLPAGMRSMRQNLPPLIQGGVFNPLRQRTWGFTVKGTDPIYTWRTGLGVTTAGRLLYAVCVRCSAEGLAEAMRAAGTEYAVHLDMNISNVGFEWWRPGERGGIETETLMRSMWKAGTSRYVDPHPRDFFYVLRRPAFGPRIEGARDRFVEPPTPVALPGGPDRWPPRVARGRLGSHGRPLTVAFLAAPRLAATVESPGDAPPSGGACHLEVHRAVLGERLPGTETGEPDPTLPTLLIDQEGVLRLRPPGPAPAGFFQQLPPLVLDGRPVEPLPSEAAGDRWLLGADAADNLLVLGGRLPPAALAAAAASLGVVTAVDPAPAGGAPRLRCGPEALVDAEPPVRAHRIRLAPAAGPPVGLPHIWDTAPPERLPATAAP